MSLICSMLKVWCYERHRNLALDSVSICACTSKTLDMQFSTWWTVDLQLGPLWFTPPLWLHLLCSDRRGLHETPQAGRSRTLVQRVPASQTGPHSCTSHVWQTTGYDGKFSQDCDVENCNRSGAWKTQEKQIDYRKGRSVSLIGTIRLPKTKNSVVIGCTHATTCCWRLVRKTWTEVKKGSGESSPREQTFNKCRCCSIPISKCKHSENDWWE